MEFIYEHAWGHASTWWPIAVIWGSASSLISDLSNWTDHFNRNEISYKTQRAGLHEKKTKTKTYSYWCATAVHFLDTSHVCPWFTCCWAVRCRHAWKIRVHIHRRMYSSQCTRATKFVVIIDHLNNIWYVIPGHANSLFMVDIQCNILSRNNYRRGAERLLLVVI